MGAIDLDAVHLADSSFWQAPASFRHDVFAALRATDPVRYYEPRRSAFAREATGFWALTRYDDVWRASRNPTVYCSRLGIDIEATPPELADTVSSMINFDDPEHARMRRLVSAGFTPRRTAQLVDQLAVAAREIVDDVLDRHGHGDEFDLVTELAARLPLRAISDMVGVPAADQPDVFAWTNALVSADDPATGIAGAAAADRALREYADALGRDRLAHPGDDLVSVLMHAEVDGERLTPLEFANFFILLLAAGNETTRNAISHGVRLLTQHPEQRRRWFDDFERWAPSAVEEIIRFETPITHMCRVLTEDVELHGVRLAAGEKVALWYTSANRDGDVFERPDEFDVTRPLQPPQVGFGAGGPHFCLGANLARREITVMFDEIRRRLPDLHVTGEPDRILSMSLNSIRSMPARVR